MQIEVVCNLFSFVLSFLLYFNLFFVVFVIDHAEVNYSTLQQLNYNSLNCFSHFVHFAIKNRKGVDTI